MKNLGVKDFFFMKYVKNEVKQIIKGWLGGYKFR